jgi:hypothetical protein
MLHLFDAVLLFNEDGWLSCLSVFYWSQVDTLQRPKVDILCYVDSVISIQIHSQKICVNMVLFMGS